jgi:hypothetical protein
MDKSSFDSSSTKLFSYAGIKFCIASAPGMPLINTPAEVQRRRTAYMEHHKALGQAMTLCKPLELQNLKHPLSRKNQESIVTSSNGIHALIPRFCPHSSEPAFFLLLVDPRRKPNIHLANP